MGCRFGGYGLVVDLRLLLMSVVLLWFCLWVFGLGFGFSVCFCVCVLVSWLAGLSVVGVRLVLCFECGLCWLGGFDEIWCFWAVA